MATPFLVVKNNAVSTTAGAIDNSTDPVTFSVAAGEGALFPSAFPFHLTIDSEILSCTARSTDSLTCTRAQQGTTIASHSSGALVELRVTAKSISDLNSAVNTLEGSDPYSQYALLAGRSAGQTLIGGTAVTDMLTLKATSAAGTTAGILLDFSGHDNSAARFPLAIKFPTTLTANVWGISLGTDNANANQSITVGTGGGIRALNFGGAYTITGEPSSIFAQVFHFGSTIILSTTTSDLNEQRIFSSAPTVQMTLNTAHANVSSSAEPWSNFRSGGTFTAQTGTETARMQGGIVHFNAVNHTIGAGWTVDTDRGLWFQAPIGTGVVTEAVAVDIPDWAARATAIYSMRNADATAQMRHKGQAVFGANAAPTNASVGLEVQSTTQAFLLPRMTTTQRDAMTALDGMLIYNTTTAQPEKRIAGAWAAF